MTTRSTIAAAVTAAALLIGAPLAQAAPPVIYGDEGDQNEYAFAAEMAAQGLTSTPENALKIATMVCETMARRAPAPATEAELQAAEREMIATMRANAYPKTVSDDIAWYTVYGAQNHSRRRSS